jgi:uridine phosphorylase
LTDLTNRAWYLDCVAEDVGDRAILVGDRGRVARVTAHMQDVAWINEDRGLTTATGTFRGHRVTVTAFGMGAPIAAVVLHELHGLGIRRFLRVGTVMVLPPARLGDLVIADGAVRRERTSSTYVPDGYPALADHDLTASLRRAAEASSASWHATLVESSDGFYTEMLDQGARMDELQRLGVHALDMETSAVLAIARALGASAGSICAATVDGRTAERLATPGRLALEDTLVEVALDALVASSPAPTGDPA